MEGDNNKNKSTELELEEIRTVRGKGSEYEDLLPVMAEKLDVESFVAELCKGFELLAEPGRGLITPASLRRNAEYFGMEGMSAEDAEAMVVEGDLDGDGALDQTEFCVLMVRLSPGMMEHAGDWLDKALSQYLTTTTSDTTSQI